MKTRQVVNRSARIRLAWALAFVLVAAVLPTLGAAPAVSAETYTLVVSGSANRSAPEPLHATTQTGWVYVFTQPATGVSRVRFYLDDPAMSGTPRQVERGAPHDFAGTAQDGSALPFKTGSVPQGQHTITAAVDLSTGGTVVLSATFLVDATSSGPSPYQLMVSPSPDRSSPKPLHGSTAEGDVHVFTAPDSNVARVRFYVDDPGLAGTPRKIESGSPYDLAGTASNGSALPFDTRTLSQGQHVVTAAVELLSGGTEVASATFTVSHPAVLPDLTVDKASVRLSGVVNGTAERAPVSLGTSDGRAATFTSSTSASWLTVEPGTGPAPGSVNVVATPGSLAVGSYTGSVTFSAQGYDPVTMTVEFWIRQTDGGTYDIVTSSSSQRTKPLLLEGMTVSGDVYVFLDPATDVRSTSWWLDDPTMQGTPLRVDTAAPFDLMPDSWATSPKPLRTTTLPDGRHTVTARVETTSGGVVVVAAAFVTDNGTNSLSWTPSTQTIDVDPSSPTPVTFEAQLAATKSGTVTTLSGGEPFVTYAGGSSVTAPATVSMTVDPAGLSPGVYRFVVTAEATGAFAGKLVVTVNVGDAQGCAPIACDLVKVDHPYLLPFDGPQGMVIDRNGTGTGFTTLIGTESSRYARNAVELDSAASAIRLSAGPGSFKENTQENALGVGFNGGVLNIVTTTLVGIPTMTGKYEQGGLWFGYDQDNVMKLDLVSTPSGPRVELILEVNGVQTAKREGPLLSLTSESVLQLSVHADPVTRKLTGSYRLDGGAASTVGSPTAPGEFFSADAAGIDPRIGTRTFAGIYATKRTAAAATTFTFSDFSVTGQPVVSATDIDFSRTSHAIDFPTSMAFGPDGRLYVLTMMGDIHVLTYDAAHRVIDDQVVGTLGQRLALGIAIDPASTQTNVIVWVSHSSPSLDNGQADSGMVSRLSGPGLATKVDIITGLPRAIANHGPNSLHFAADGRLFMAIGGNTGAGAANNADTEFGDRGEQPLSAALLVADVKAAGFDGTCGDPTNIYSSDDCDVRVFASGLRNTYDFVFHSNGHIYGPDNGLGVAGSFPPSPTSPCDGFGSTSSYQNGGHNPGEQPDELNLIEQGGFYGHPNPTRAECVFGDGSFQGVSPSANYKPATHDLGLNRSANGIIEYRGDAFCGSLRSALLVTNYSVGDDVVLLQLAEDGRSVVSAVSLISGLSDPLPIVEAPDGSFVVGEFGGGKVTRVAPVDTGCWSESTPMPVGLLDAGGVAIGDDIYVVGGKTADGPQSTVHVLDVPTGAWSTTAALPGPAVENPAVVAVGGRLYAFGGSTGPFSGAVGRSAVYDPASGSWTTLADMPTPRGGAAALHLNGKIYVIGGMTGDGASSAIVEVFDIGSGTWSTGPAMSVARDNAGAAVVDGVLYVFGGRTRLASGTTVNGALTSVEALAGAAGTWASRAPLPTGRRTMGSAVVNGDVLLIGGEGAADGSAFDATELYDPQTDAWRRLWPMPTPRHGAVTAVVTGEVHVLGGGPTGGSSWTTAHEVFRPPR